jgi:hypothetical protein
MGRKAIIKDNKIKCIRGPVADMNIVVKDRQGTEWYSKYTQVQFAKQCQDDYSIQVYDQAGQPAKKFRKGYLTFVSEFETVLKNEKPSVSTIINHAIPDLDDVDPEEAKDPVSITEVDSEETDPVSITEIDPEDADVTQDDEVNYHQHKADGFPDQ